MYNYMNIPEDLGLLADAGRLPSTMLRDEQGRLLPDEQGVPSS